MKRSIIAVVVIAILILGTVLWWENASSPVNPDDNHTINFMVGKGDDIREISVGLKTKGLIKSPVAFFLQIKLLNIDKKIQAGEFRLSPSMIMREIAENLTHGSFDISITFTPGQRARELAEILKKNITTYSPSWENILIANEGYLFPDTYFIAKDADIETIVSKMKDNFDRKYSEINTANSKLNKSQIAILASLIEREANTDSEKPVIAGILINRLNAGIALQVDATIQYAKGKDMTTGKWWMPVTTEEYKSVISNYNTYLFTGLPPGPISNPGLESLKAAANPTNTNYLYYLHDKNGTIHYAKTIEEHEENVQKYTL